MKYSDVSDFLAGRMTGRRMLAFVSNISGSDGPALTEATAYPLTTLQRRSS
jgi:uncharacterized transporter YbjL